MIPNLSPEEQAFHKVWFELFQNGIAMVDMRRGPRYAMIYCKAAIDAASEYAKEFKNPIQRARQVGDTKTEETPHDRG